MGSVVYINDLGSFQVMQHCVNKLFKYSNLLFNVLKNFFPDTVVCLCNDTSIAIA